MRSGSQNGSNSCLGFGLTFFIFLLVGSGLSWWGWNILQDAKASASWPKAQSVITESRVRHSRDSDGGNSYQPKISYEYSVKNLNYKNQTIKFGENSYSNHSDAEYYVSRYPIGQRVSVFYDPKRPDKSVLEPGVTSGSYIVIGIGALFVAISLIMVPLGIIFRNR